MQNIKLLMLILEFRVAEWQNKPTTSLVVVQNCSKFKSYTCDIVSKENKVPAVI
jgi:hypothetical protein